MANSWSVTAHGLVRVRGARVTGVAGRRVAAHVTDDGVVSLGHPSLLLGLWRNSGDRLGAALGARTLHLGYQPRLDRGIVMVVVMVVVVRLLLRLWLCLRL